MHLELFNYWGGFNEKYPKKKVEKGNIRGFTKMRILGEVLNAVKPLISKFLKNEMEFLVKKARF